MIFKHYRELVTPEQAKEWFAITPAVVGTWRTEKQVRDQSGTQGDGKSVDV
jgi:hypothetical protein